MSDPPTPNVQVRIGVVLRWVKAQGDTMSAGMAQAAGTGRTKDLISTVSQISHALMGEVAKVIIGKEENLLRVSVGILSNGNMLLEDFPGLAKTLLANTFAKACLLYTSPSPRDGLLSRMPSSA